MDADLCWRSTLCPLPSEELPGESGLLERLANRFRAKTAWPVFWRLEKKKKKLQKQHCMTNKQSAKSYFLKVKIKISSKVMTFSV